jgi:hypothetical protein
MAEMKANLMPDLRAFYTAAPEPALVEVPDLAFLMIDGHGDPNVSAEYAEAIQALYSIAYTLKFAIKRSGGPDFVVMPLEGLWWVPDMAEFSVGDKSSWFWTMLILQPDEVSPEMFADAAATAAKKKPSDAIARVRLERMAEGGAAQVMHVGPYAAPGC